MIRQAQQQLETISGWRPFAIILLLVMPLFLFGTFNHDLWRPAEAREAGIAVEMIENGNWAATYLSGRLFLEKPPLYTWALALPLLVFGRHDWAVRIPVFIFTVATLALLYPYARRRLGVFGAQAAVAVLATMALFLEVNHGAMIDNGLMFFIMLAMLAFDRLSEPDAVRANFWAFVFYFATAGAFLCKGLIGPGLLAAAALAHILFSRDWRLPLRARPLLGVAILALFIGPWLVALWLRGGREYFHTFFVVNHLMRFQGAEGPQGEWFYYIPVFLASTLPWIVFLPNVVWILRKRMRSELPKTVNRRHLDLAWITGMFLLLSLSGSKDNQYIMPMLPPVAVLVGAWVEESCASSNLPRWTWISTALFALLVILFAIGMPWAPLWLGGEISVLMIIAAVLLPVLAGRALLALARGQMREWWRRLVILPVFAGLALGLLIEPVLNDLKTMSPLSVALEGACDRSATLLAYDCGENTLGALIFYGWKTRLADTEAELDSFGQAHEPAMLVVQADSGAHPIVDVLLKTPHWSPAGCALVGGRNFYFLRNAAAHKAARNHDS